MKFLYLVVLNLILGLVYIAKNIFLKSSDALNIWFTVLNLTVDIVNLIFVIGFYVNDQKERKKSEKREYKFFWYKEFVLPKINDVIKNFIDNVNLLIKECEFLNKNTEEIPFSDYREYVQNIISKYTKLNNTSKEEIRYAMNIIDIDISRGIIAELIKLQDVFTNEIIKTNPNLDNLRHVFSIEQSILRNKLYEHGKDNLM